MAKAAPRLNAYGDIIAPLTDAAEERLEAKPTNQQAIMALHALLRELWAAKLRRGWYGVVSLEISINDGIIEQDVCITDKRSRRLRE
jgi:hypothetical protein